LAKDLPNEKKAEKNLYGVAPPVEAGIFGRRE
jgi:hypothetical protein